jgi:hypothetical protein
VLLFLDFVSFFIVSNVKSEFIRSIIFGVKSCKQLVACRFRNNKNDDCQRGGESDRYFFFFIILVPIYVLLFCVIMKEFYSSR